MTLRDALTDVGFKAMNTGHRAILWASGGRILHSAFGMPVVELRTIGRTTGQVRTTFLTTPVHDEHRVVLVASKGGDDRDPQWYRNLTATPAVEIGRNGHTEPFEARTASTEERAELWPLIVASYKGYDGYQARAGRQIPVIICEPASPA
jgi:deazaflavin-dependent oxidoreductase (nitroreductase family)